MDGRTAALIPAAGRGERLGPGAPKALRDIGGTPMLVHAVKAISSCPAVSIVIVAAPTDNVDEVTALLGQQEFPSEVHVVAGGDTRVESVARALINLPDDIDVVLVHDAARPLVPEEVVASVVSAVRAGHDAVVPALPMTDTVKSVDGNDDVVATLDRSSLRNIQTPQGFRREILQRAHAIADDEGITDDAGMVEALGITVHVVPGHEEALKVTRPFDVVVAEAILAKRRSLGALG
jgi:2-C-methyl-D-erythritol 4-phosphate cytidylyltransferase